VAVAAVGDALYAAAGTAAWASSKAAKAPVARRRRGDRPAGRGDGTGKTDLGFWDGDRIRPHIGRTRLRRSRHGPVRCGLVGCAQVL